MLLERPEKKYWELKFGGFKGKLSGKNCNFALF